MKYGDQKKRVRKFLRDLNGDIWTDAFLERQFSDIQRDLQNKTQVLEGIDIVRVPPLQQMTYSQPWEYEYTGQTRVQQVLRYSDQSQISFCFRWELAIEQGSAVVPEENGDAVTQAWEAWFTSATALPIKLHFPANFHKAKAVAFDKESIPFRDKRHIMRHDPRYFSRRSIPQCYYVDDVMDNTFVLYPTPNEISFTDLVDSPNYEIVATSEFELDYATNAALGVKEGDDYNYLYSWEEDISPSSHYGAVCFYIWEAGQYGGGANVLYITSEADAGVGVQQAGAYFTSDDGMAVDVLSAENQVLMVYDITPGDLVFDYDESEFPEYLQKYIECGVLARAYQANTDVKIPSLAAYWQRRYELGIEAVKQFVGLRTQDRRYRLAPTNKPRRGVARARLPDNYPRI